MAEMSEKERHALLMSVSVKLTKLRTNVADAVMGLHEIEQLLGRILVDDYSRAQTDYPETR
jgi:hypothetical protein